MLHGIFVPYGVSTGYFVGYPLGCPTGYLTEYPMGHPMVCPMGHPIGMPWSTPLDTIAYAMGRLNGMSHVMHTMRLLFPWISWCTPVYPTGFPLRYQPTATTETCRLAHEVL